GPFGLALPVWVDDAAFDLDFHIRRAELPHPGGRVELGEQVQRILSPPPDRAKPPWALHGIEGVWGRRGARPSPRPLLPPPGPPFPGPPPGKPKPRPGRGTARVGTGRG